MPSLPLVVSIIVALAAVPAALRELERRGLAHENYRGARVAYPAGLAAVAASLIALGPVAVADHASDGDVWPAIGAPVGIAGMVLYVVGVAMLGLIDDVLGAGDERGWRGHARATAGRLALVLLVEDTVLAEITGERPEGSFGYKDTASEALPDLSD